MSKALNLDFTGMNLEPHLQNDLNLQHRKEITETRREAVETTLEYCINSQYHFQRDNRKIIREVVIEKLEKGHRMTAKSLKDGQI